MSVETFRDRHRTLLFISSWPFGKQLAVKVDVRWSWKTREEGTTPWFAPVIPLLPRQSRDVSSQRAYEECIHSGPPAESPALCRAVLRFALSLKGLKRSVFGSAFRSRHLTAGRWDKGELGYLGAVRSIGFRFPLEAQPDRMHEHAGKFCAALINTTSKPVGIRSFAPAFPWSHTGPHGEQPSCSSTFGFIE